MSLNERTAMQGTRVMPITASADVRELLAAILRGEDPKDLPADDAGQGALLFAAKEEGVVALVCAQMAAIPEVGKYPPGLLRQFEVANRAAIAQAMYRRAETRRVVDCLRGLGLAPILLKGAALAEWLYPAPHLRACGDVDLLLADPAEVELALDALHGLGYDGGARAIAGDLVGFELNCSRTQGPGPGLDLDLHWRWSNTVLFANALTWQELHTAAVGLPRLGGGALGLAPQHAFLHACVHRATNLQFGDADQLRWLYDIHLLSANLQPEEWRQVLDLAKARGLAGTCLQALLAARRSLHSEPPPGVREELAGSARGERLRVAWMHNWLYAQWATGTSLPGLRLPLRWLRQRLFPARAYLRETCGVAGGNSLSVALVRFKSAVRRMLPRL